MDALDVRMEPRRGGAKVTNENQTSVENLERFEEEEEEADMERPEKKSRAEPDQKRGSTKRTSTRSTKARVV